MDATRKFQMCCIMLACDKVKLLEVEFKQKRDGFTVMLSVINAQKIEGSQG